MIEVGTHSLGYFSCVPSFGILVASYYMPHDTTTSLSACRIRRGGETRCPSRYVPWGRGRATGKFPKARRVHVRRWNRCGRLRRLRVRMRSCPVSRGWPRRFLSWQRSPQLVLFAATATFALFCLQADQQRPRVGSCTTPPSRCCSSVNHVEVEVKVAAK